MIQNVLREIGGVANYGVISICLFFVVFTTAMIWSLCLKKPFLQSMSSLPLENSDETSASVEPTLKGANTHE